jgi:hypothetical protein
MVEMITATASIWELIAFVSALAGLIGSAVGLGLPTWDLMVAQNGENAALRRSGHERLRLSIILVVAFAAFFFHASVLILQPPISLDRPVTFAGRVYGVVMLIFGWSIFGHVIWGLFSRRRDFDAAIALDQRRHAEAQVRASAHLAEAARGAEE